MHRALVFCVLLMTGLTACATTQVISPKTRVKVSQANVVLDEIVSQTRQFYTDAEAVRMEVRTLYRHPGWPEMQEIINAMADIQTNREASLTESQVIKATEDWSRKWSRPWQDTFSEYLSLVKRCSGLELQRISLQSKILEAQAKFLGAAVTEYSGGRYDQGRSLEEIVEILGRSAGELDSYTVDSMGLYP